MRRRRLIGLASNDNEKVAASALSSLGAIASPESVAAIQQSLNGKESLRVAAAEACLTAADTLLADGKHSAAAEIFTALGKADLPKHLNVAARFGQIRSGTDDVDQLMMQYLSSDDNDLFRIGLELAHQLPGEETTRGLLDQMKSMSTSRQALLLYVLGSRGDASALPAVLEAAGSDVAVLRVAAVEVLGTIGDESVVPTLLHSAESVDDSERQAAELSLAELKGADVDILLLDKLSASSGRQRIVLVDAAGRRGISDAMPKLLEFMTSDDADLRRASIDALALTVSADELPPMIDRLIAADSGESSGPLRDALQKACQRMADRDAASAVLLSRMPGASPAAKAELLDLLIYVGGQKALEAIGTAASSDDDVLADAATQALGKWLTPDVAPVLLELATSGNEKYRVRCLRGYIRVIRQFGLKPNQRLRMSKQAFGAATRDEERKLVLDTYTRFPAVSSLNAVTPHLSNPALKEEASKAAVMICEKIVNTDRKAVAAVMPKILAATNDADTVRRANVLISQASAE